MKKIRTGDENNFPKLQHTGKHFLIIYTVYKKFKEEQPSCPYVIRKFIIGCVSREPLLDPDFYIALDDLETLQEIMIKQGFVRIAKHPSDAVEIICSYI
jgi:hypothetical protein